MRRKASSDLPFAGAPKTEVAVDALTGVAGHTDSQRGERRIREEEGEERRECYNQKRNKTSKRREYGGIHG